MIESEVLGVGEVVFGEVLELERERERFSLHTILPSKTQQMGGE